MVFTAKITNVQDEKTRIVVDYSIYNGKKEVMTKTINLEGDNIDIQQIKNHMRKQLNRIDGVFSKKEEVISMINKEFELDNKELKIVSSSMFKK